MNSSGFFYAMGDYITHAPLLNSWFLGPIFVSILLCYGGSLLLNRSVVKPVDRDVFTHQFYILQARVFAGFGVTVLTILGILICWARGLYQSEDDRFHYMESSHLLVLMIGAGFSGWALLQLRDFYTKSRFRFITQGGNTYVKHQTLIEQAKDSFDKTKVWVWSLVVANLLGFVIYMISPKTLVSIVIDDSGSMGEKLKVGSTALSETLAQLNTKYTDVMLTSFGASNPSPTAPFASFAALASVNKPDSLDARTTFFEDPLMVSDQVLTLKADKGFGLNVAIWQNFLKSREKDEEIHYDNRVMLIITDGEEYDKSWYTTKFCTPNYGFSNFYNDKIYFLDLLPPSVGVSPDSQGFRTIMKDCYGAESRRNGYLDSEYLSALSEFFQPYRFDINLPLWVCALSVFYAVILFFGVNVELTKLTADRNETV